MRFFKKFRPQISELKKNRTRHSGSSFLPNRGHHKFQLSSMMWNDIPHFNERFPKRFISSLWLPLWTFLPWEVEPHDRFSFMNEIYSKNWHRFCGLLDISGRVLLSLEGANAFWWSISLYHGFYPVQWRSGSILFSLMDGAGRFLVIQYHLASLSIYVTLTKITGDFVVVPCVGPASVRKIK